MAKVTMNDMVFEGTPEEIAAVFAEIEKRQAKDGTSEDAPCYVEEPKEETFKVGDYVKIVGDNLGYHSFEYGQIVKVVRLDGWHGTSDRLLCEGEEDHRQSIERDDVVKVTKEEATEAKWEKLNRKVDEFKSGDIVRVTDTTFGHKVGTIGELVPAPEFSGTDVGVLANGIKKSHIGQMELITPVEARFDR